MSTNFHSATRFLMIFSLCVRLYFLVEEVDIIAFLVKKNLFLMYAYYRSTSFSTHIQHILRGNISNGNETDIVLVKAII